MRAGTIQTLGRPQFRHTPPLRFDDRLLLWHRRLAAATTLYWGVRAKGANGPSLWSQARSFKSGNPPPCRPSLSPASNALLTSYQPTLDWSDSSVPAGTTLDHYAVQVATDSSFTNRLYNTSTTLSAFRLPCAARPQSRLLLAGAGLQHGRPL